MNTPSTISVVVEAKPIVFRFAVKDPERLISMIRCIERKYSRDRHATVIAEWMTRHGWTPEEAQAEYSWSIPFYMEIKEVFYSNKSKAN